MDCSFAYTNQHLNQRPEAFVDCLIDKCNLGIYPQACSRWKAASKLPQKAPDTPFKACVHFLLSDIKPTLCSAWDCKNCALETRVCPSWEKASTAKRSPQMSAVFLLKGNSAEENNAHTKQEGRKGSESGLLENIYLPIGTQRNLSIPRHSSGEAGGVQRICCRRLFKVKLPYLSSSRISASSSRGPWQHSITLQGMPSWATPSSVREQAHAFAGEQERTEELLMNSNQVAGAGIMSLSTPSKLVHGTFSKSSSLCVFAFPS